MQCELCSDTANLDAVTIMFFCVSVFGLGVAVYVYYFTNIREQIKSMDDVYVLLFSKLGMLSTIDASTSVVPVKVVEEAVAIGRRWKARVKIYITLWQIVSLLPFALNLDFPNVYSAIASALNVFNLNVSTSSLVTCGADDGYDAIDALIVDTVYPIVVVILLRICEAIHVWIKSSDDVRMKSNISARYFNIFLVFTYLILPFTSVQIFQTFSCRDVDPDDVEPGEDQYMTVDYSVSCSSSKYQFGYVWAIVSVFVYPVGIPLYYFYVLYTTRHEIKSRNEITKTVFEREERKDRLNPLRFLFEYYEPRFWYWEVVDTLNRLFLTGVLVVIGRGSANQIIVGIVVALVFLKLCDVYRPYIDRKVQAIKDISQWQIFSVFILALILKAKFNSIETGVLDAFLILAIVVNFVIDGLQILTTKLLSLALWSKGSSSSCTKDGMEMAERCRVSDEKKAKKAEEVHPSAVSCPLHVCNPENSA